MVVLDRDLPGLHGDTLCRMIADSGSPAMVLMLTVAGSPGERVSGLRLGADDYLAKPFHFPELVLRVRALARRQPAARARVFRAAGLELDPAGTPLPATGSCSTCPPGSSASWRRCCAPSPPCCPPRTCSNRCGTEHTDPFSNVVSVTISRLRRKLGDPPVIHTIPNVGYHIQC